MIYISGIRVGNKEICTRMNFVILFLYSLQIKLKQRWQDKCHEKYNKRQPTNFKYFLKGNKLK
jgi:hypothetical protein